MKPIILSILLVFSLLSCQSAIKNTDAKVNIEPGTAIKESTNEESVEKPVSIKQPVVKETLPITSDQLLGFWVGYFKNSSSDARNMYFDEGYSWNRDNKINISIDKITDSLVIGHSVVAGNDRPFKGNLQENIDNSFSFKVQEPGNNKYDGEFQFTIKDNQLTGTWVAYKNIDIKKRKYTLTPKSYTYNPDIMLEEAKAYVNWHKVIETKEKVEYEENEFEVWVNREFASATNLIYKLNASNQLLEKSVVENLKKGDLTIIRNTIYARHGYSFKNRPLRVFFDAQSWYIPVHTNIKKAFTDLEKQNIELLLRYEKNAAEYYDTFGRG